MEEEKPAYCSLNTPILGFQSGKVPPCPPTLFINANGRPLTFYVPFTLKEHNGVAAIIRVRVLMSSPATLRAHGVATLGWLWPADRRRQECRLCDSRPTGWDTVRNRVGRGPLVQQADRHFGVRDRFAQKPDSRGSCALSVEPAAESSQTSVRFSVDEQGDGRQVTGRWEHIDDMVAALQARRALLVARGRCSVAAGVSRARVGCSRNSPSSQGAAFDLTCNP